jgi:hypothetical protein
VLRQSGPLRGNHKATEVFVLKTEMFIITNPLAFLHSTKTRSKLKWAQFPFCEKYDQIEENSIFYRIFQN